MANETNDLIDPTVKFCQDEIKLLKKQDKYAGVYAKLFTERYDDLKDNPGAIKSLFKEIKRPRRRIKRVEYKSASKISTISLKLKQLAAAFLRQKKPDEKLLQTIIEFDKELIIHSNKLIMTIEGSPSKIDWAIRSNQFENAVAVVNIAISEIKALEATLEALIKFLLDKKTDIIYDLSNSAGRAILEGRRVITNPNELKRIAIECGYTIIDDTKEGESVYSKGKRLTIISRHPMKPGTARDALEAMATGIPQTELK